MRRMLAGAVIAGLVVGCAYNPPPVTVVGRQEAVAALVGDWWGDYRSEGPLERRGTIHFALVAGDDHAHGDVLMTPAGTDRPYGRHAGEPGARTMVPEPLTIRIVRVDDDEIRGELERYWDPDRETMATTTFRGTLRENLIVGTFLTTFATGGLEARGRWRVTRTERR